MSFLRFGTWDNSYFVGFQSRDRSAEMTKRASGRGRSKCHHPICSLPPSLPPLKSETRMAPSFLDSIRVGPRASATCPHSVSSGTPFIAIMLNWRIPSSPPISSLLNLQHICTPTNDILSLSPPAPSLHFFRSSLSLPSSFVPPSPSELGPSPVARWLLPVKEEEEEGNGAMRHSDISWREGEVGGCHKSTFYL